MQSSTITASSPVARPRRRTVEETFSITSSSVDADALHRHAVGTSWSIVPAGRSPLSGILCELAQSGDSLSVVVKLNPLFSEVRPQLLPLAARISAPFGGELWFFLCPGDGCGRRAWKLFLHDGYFRCRRCANLAYLGNVRHRNSAFDLARLERRLQRVKEKEREAIDLVETTRLHALALDLRRRVRKLRKRIEARAGSSTRVVGNAEERDPSPCPTSPSATTPVPAGNRV